MRRLILLCVLAVMTLAGCGSQGDETKSVSTTTDAPTTTERPNTVRDEALRSAATAVTTTTAPRSTVGERTSPVPKGSEFTFRSGWVVKVAGTTPNGTAAVLAANRFNDEPDAGKQFYLVNIVATYTGQGSRSALGDLQFSALDSSNVQIREGQCGVIPNDFDSFKDVFSGGSISGNLCFAVSTTTVASLLMYAESGLFNGQRTFFALT